MSWFQWWRRREIEERDLDEELKTHLEIEARRRSESGRDPLAAAYAARQALGNLVRIREETREVWGWAPFERFLDDVRFGLRMLRKSPGWTAVMAATLALGIGLTTAIFSLVYSILLHPFPYPDPERLVVFWSTSSAAAAANLGRFQVASANWIDLRAQSKMFEDIALTRAVANFNLTGDGPPERLQGGRTSWNLPQVLGVHPLLGRMFTEEEAGRDAKVAVLSYGFWERRFARDPGVVGRNIQLNGEAYRVIGVVPPQFRYPTQNFELWTPLFIPLDEIQSRFSFNYRSIGRLKPGVTLRQAQSEMSAIMRHLAEQYPRSNKDLGVLVEPLLDNTVGQFRSVLYVLLASVGCLLLIGGINLGGLLIARASARTREIAVRAALGASAARLRRQMLAEVLPLSVVGGAGGVLLAWWLLKLLVPWLPRQLPGLESIELHGPVLASALALSVLVVLLAGMLPARLAAGVQLAGTMQQDSRTVAGGGAIRNALVAVQIAVTLVLLFAGGLLVRSLVALLNVNPGFSTQGVLTMHLAVTRAEYSTDSQVADYYGRLAARVKTVPGVIEAGVVNLLPFGENRQVNPLEFEGKLEAGRMGADWRSVTPGYFSAMGIPLLRGRDFSERDKEGAPLVGIIDEHLALTVFGSGDPLGQRCRFATGANTFSPWIQIVGVAGHIRNDSLETDPRPQAYWPEAQQMQDRGVLVVKTTGHPGSFTAAVVEQIQREDADQPVYDVRSMEEWLDRSLQSRRLLTGLVTLFGASSLLLACLGLYGVVSYGAGLRLREFGIRMALGAQPNAVRRLVLAHAGRLAVWGSAIGLALAWPVGSALQGLLYGVRSADTVALATAPCLLLVIAFLAGLGPARRAGRVDPAVTLRGE
jgi:putative ABC transport system permease protein